jgi:hypothetical protein
MSYNPNQPYDQRQQQQLFDPNQQQLQIDDPQSTTSSPPSNPTGGGGGNYQQSQQSYSWTDGNTQGQHHQSQQSWSWQGQGHSTNPIALQSPPPVFPPLLQDHNSQSAPAPRTTQAVERQRRQNAERNSQQLADQVRSQATPPAAPSVGAFDMSALQEVVRDTQAHQLTAKDIERVIEEQVSKRLVGMATKQDI